MSGRGVLVYTHFVWICRRGGKILRKRARIAFSTAQAIEIRVSLLAACSGLDCTAAIKLHCRCYKITRGISRACTTSFVLSFCGPARLRGRLLAISEARLQHSFQCTRTNSSIRRRRRRSGTTTQATGRRAKDKFCEPVVRNATTSIPFQFPLITNALGPSGMREDMRCYPYYEAASLAGAFRRNLSY